MDFLERYRNGEFEQVWDELQALGQAVRLEPAYTQARRVAAETMRRVRYDCELIVARLLALGYTFGIYPDGKAGYYTRGPLVPPSEETRTHCATLEQRAGPLPISLVAFWERAGSVDLVGKGPAGWPRLLDPLVVEPPEVAVHELELSETGEPEAVLAPDDLHKDNISGGAPYSASLPNPMADFILQNERHHMLFVPYLRLAILRWGGFPGLDAQEQPGFEPLAGLIEGLEPF